MKIRHNILIVDDDADDREIIRDAFTNSIDNQDYTLLENGERLLEYLENNHNEQSSAIILLDLNMPGKDGRETLKEIKSNIRYNRIPTIIFTTSSSHRDKQTAYDLGANLFITKPDTFNKLIDMAKSISNLWLQ